MVEEFDAKVFLNKDTNGKTGTLVIKCKPPYDKGLITGISFDLRFVDDFYEATIKKGV